jgi:hypothetical protein
MLIQAKFGDWHIRKGYDKLPHAPQSETLQAFKPPCAYTGDAAAMD